MSEINVYCAPISALSSSGELPAALNCFGPSGDSISGAVAEGVPEFRSINDEGMVICFQVTVVCDSEGRLQVMKSPLSLSLGDSSHLFAR